MNYNSSKDSGSQQLKSGNEANPPYMPPHIQQLSWHQNYHADHRGHQQQQVPISNTYLNGHLTHQYYQQYPPMQLPLSAHMSVNNNQIYQQMHRIINKSNAF